MQASDSEKFLVSVIVPAYNVDEFLEKCIDSLLSQTYDNIQIIIIDDGSSDKTASICDNYAKKYAKIIAVHQKNKGVSVARNVGLKMATGKYVTFVDSDDFVDKEYIKTLVDNIKGAELAIVDYYIVEKEVGATSDKVVKRNNKMKKKTLRLSQKETLDSIYVYELYEGYLWNKLFDREILQAFDIEFHEDIEIWEDLLFCVEYMRHIRNANYVNSPLYYYVQRTDSVMHSKSQWHQNTRNKVMEKIYDYAKAIGGKFEEETTRRYANVLINSVINKNPNKITLQQIREMIYKVQPIEKYADNKERLKVFMFKIFPHISFGLMRVIYH